MVESRPTNGGMVLSRTVDFLAASAPDQVWMTLPRSTDLTKGWRAITFKDLACAVNNMARWIESRIGISRDGETAAYMGLNDLRYVVSILALNKTGYKTLLASPRNAIEGQVSLLKTTECYKILCSEAVQAHTDALRTAEPRLEIYRIPEMENILRPEVPTEHYQGHDSGSKDEQVVVFHTSGSTGAPKPIPYTNGGIASLALAKELPVPEGRRNHFSELFSNRPPFTMVPFFHIVGFCTIIRSILCQGPLIMPPISVLPNIDIAQIIINGIKPWIWVVVPSMLDEFCQTQHGLETLRSLQYVFYAGAPLTRECGNKVAKVTHLVNYCGATEVGPLPSLMSAAPEEWEYIEFFPGVGIEMEPYIEGLYEMVVKRVPDKTHQAILHAFTDAQEWRMKDLWERHPTKSSLWRYNGRKDEIIVLSNAEKVHPLWFEKTMEEHPAVKGALLVGNGHFQTALLIELDGTYVKNEDLSSFVDEVWPTVQRANQAVPGHAKVWRSKIAIASQDKMFVRLASKGTIARRSTVQLYEKEIGALYAHEDLDDKLGELQRGADLLTTKAFLRRAFSLVLPDLTDYISDETDIFTKGVDSLQVLALATSLTYALRPQNYEEDTAITPRTVYTHPTLNSLAVALHGICTSNHGMTNGSRVISRELSMANMVEKYTRDLTLSHFERHTPSAAEYSVILTGSTGSFGSYILRELISSPYVSNIYCLNRSDDAESRQSKVFHQRGIERDFSKVTFLRSDLSQKQFGLSQNTYHKLAGTVSIVIHNAWAVDFNKSLASFEEPHVAGMRRCVDFSLCSQHQAHIVFISSISSVGNWPASQTGDVPERFLADDSIPLPSGYGESKHVAERILGRTSASAEHDHQSRHEWLPSLVISSKAMGIIPESLGSQSAIDWIPVDVAAKVVVELTLSIVEKQQLEPLDVFHVVNPKETTWAALLPLLQDDCTGDGGMETIKAVPFAEWIAELRKVPLTRAEVERKPAVKLLDFYEQLIGEGRGLPRLATVRVVENSDAMRNLQPIDAKLMRNWSRGWRI